jgi:hypothetical protein
MAAELFAGKPESTVPAALERHFESEKQGANRVIVRFVKCSIRLSDVDNLYAGYKSLLDQLRCSGLIRADDPQTIHLQVSQLKVARLKEQGTYIQIIYPQ